MSQILTPELDKLRAIQDKSQTMGEFLDSLSNQGLYLCEKAPDSYGMRTVDEMGDEWDSYIPTMIPVEKLLAGFFGIDLQKVEDEKRAILASIQSS